MNCSRAKEKYCRGSIDHSTRSVGKMKCKLVMSIVLLLGLVFLSARWINWDAGVVFYEPSLDDIKIGRTVDVNVERLGTRRWAEKREYMRQVFREACAKYEVHVFTNLNVRILGMYVEDSVAYRCDDDKMWVNLKVEPSDTGNRLVCVEYYGGESKVRNDRYHPLAYTYVDGETVENHTSISYEETCLLYQTNELLRGTWKP